MTMTGIRALRALVAGVVLVAPSSAFAECVRLNQDSSPCARFRNHSEIFIGRVVAVEGIGDQPRQRVTFTDVERIKGSRATPVMVFEAHIEGFRFQVGSVVLVYTDQRDGVWSNICNPTTIASDPLELEALRALRDGQPGGALTLWTSRYRPELSRKVVVRQGARVVRGGQTGGYSSLDIGWLPSGVYSIDLFDIYNRYVKTMMVTIRGCISVQFDPGEPRAFDGER